jgi:hypothetical protein
MPSFKNGQIIFKSQLTEVNTPNNNEISLYQKYNTLFAKTSSGNTYDILNPNISGYQTTSAALISTNNLLSLDTNNVKLTGNQSISGAKTFRTNVIIGSDPGGSSLLRLNGSITLSNSNPIYAGGEAAQNVRL